MFAMLLFLPLQAQVPAPQVQSQSIEITAGETTPPQMDALLKAKNWAGLADWFDAAPAATRGRYYEYWIQSLNRSQRWNRLAVVCEALQSLLETKSGPRLGTYRLYRAQALGHLGRHAEAAQIHTENGRLGSPDGFTNACAEARLAEDWALMFTIADELLEKAPNHALGTAYKGEALARLGRLEDAEPLLRAAVTKDPKIAYAWNNLGRCLNEKQAWAEACDCFEKALAIEPNQLEALFNRGHARFELKQYKESRDDFRAASILRPGDPVLAENLRQAERYAALSESKHR